MFLPTLVVDNCSTENIAQALALLVILHDLAGDDLLAERHKDAHPQTVEQAVMQMADLSRCRCKKTVRIYALPHTTSPY
jgi:hypothetical protein